MTLQLAFVTVVSPDKAAVSPLARIFLGLSLVGFLAAAVCGVLTNLPRTWSEMKPDSLRALVSDRYWDADEEKARKRVAAAQLAVLTDSMRLVQRMRKRLTTAIVAEVGAMTMPAIAVLLVMAEK